jgi:serine/threonine protein kinase
MQKLETGAEFGAYTIEGFIAGGGMGEVYAARHTVYGSPVALKVLHEELHVDTSWRLRFNEEGVIGQQLKHPHVLAARELVEHATRVALVMDLVRGGQTLQRIVTREFGTGLPLVAALQVFLGILQGVEYAHGKSVIHGDIKPENVLIHGDFRDPATWVPMVTDFGTVGLIAHPVMIEGQIAVVASPRYASPEHLLGVDKLEPRSDIYSLGLLLHFLLTGRHASEARTVLEASERVWLPVPMLHMVDQPEAVIGLYQRATSVEAGDRFTTCRELALAIRQILDELGVPLDLEDLKADLATEVMEERLRMKAEAEQAKEGLDPEEDHETKRHESTGSAREPVEGPPASEVPTPHETEALVSTIPPEPESPGVEPPSGEGPVASEDVAAPVDAAAAAGQAGDPPALEPEPAPDRAAAWASLASEVSLSEAPTTRLPRSPSEPPTPPPAETQATFPTSQARLANAISEYTPLPASTPAPVSSAPSAQGVPVYVYVAVGLAVAVILAVLVMLYPG